MPLALDPSAWRLDDVLAARRAGIRRDLDLLRAGRRPLDAADRLVAPYLFGRRVLGREVEGATLARLRQATRRIEAVRGHLHHGRGNVRPDVQASENESARRALTVRSLLEYFRARKPGREYWATPTGRGQARAAAAALLGAGNCNEHQDLLAHLHAPHIAGTQTLYATQSSVLDHGWVELRTGSHALPSDAVLDAWSGGPAVLREDTRFAGDAARLRTVYHYDGATGPQGARAFEQLRHRFATSARYAAHVQESLAALRDGGYAPPMAQLWNAPPPVTSDGFAEAVAQRRRSMGRFAQSIAAVRVARDLDESVRGAVRRAERAVHGDPAQAWG